MDALETYLSSQNVDAIIKDLVVNLMKAKPEEAAPYMLKILMLRNAGVLNADVGVSDVTDSGSVLAIAHEDQATQAYINNRQLPQLFKHLLDKLLVDQPEDVFQCMVQGLVELQAAQPAPL